jgi:hypothetical protein
MLRPVHHEPVRILDLDDVGGEELRHLLEAGVPLDCVEIAPYRLEILRFAGHLEILQAPLHRSATLLLDASHPFSHR